jgi:hypothetical protein
MQLSRPPEVHRLRADVASKDLQHRIQVGELQQRDEKGCLDSSRRPDGPDQDQVWVGSVRGGDYRTVGRKALSAEENMRKFVFMVKKMTTHIFVWTRLTSPERTAD